MPDILQSKSRGDNPANSKAKTVSELCNPKMKKQSMQLLQPVTQIGQNCPSLAARIWRRHWRPTCLRFYPSPNWTNGYRQSGFWKSFGTNRAVPVSSGSEKRPNEECCPLFAAGASFSIDHAPSWNGLISENAGLTA